MLSRTNSRIKALALLVAIITISVYLPALNNDFVNWDDQQYVYENSHISPIDFKFLKWMFTTFHASNWHPMTWLSIAIDYAIWGLKPVGYHITSIVLHGLNTFLVVMLTINLIVYSKDNRLSGAVIDNTRHSSNTPVIAGAVTGLLFGLHPLHVESVAWIAERKDVLYAFFFLLSLIYYLKYTSSNLQKQKVLRYIFCLLFFVLALMSKPMAVTLPAILILLDIYPLERLSLKSVFTSHRRILIEKLPFIGLSLASSFITVIAQQAGGAISSLETYPLWTRIWVASRAPGFYLYKMVWPLDLAPFYPYPAPDSIFSFEYIFTPVLAVFITTSCIFLWSRQKLFLTVWSYFIMAMLPVMGIVQVGGQSVADRYTYMPGLGPMFLAGLFTAWSWGKLRRNQLIKKMSFIAVLFFIVFFGLSILTVKQIRIWKDSLTLWNAELRVFPDNSKAFVLLGDAYYSLGKFKTAIEHYDSAIKINPNISTIYYNRGLTYLMMGNHRQAILDFNKSISLNPENNPAYNERVFAYKLAVKDYSRGIRSNPLNIEYYINRGVILARLGQFEQALKDFNKAISLKPGLAFIYYNRGLVYMDSGDYQKAVRDFQIAASMGDKKAQNYLKSKGMDW